MRMKEEFVYFLHPENETHFFIELAGTTYPNENYFVRRENAFYVVVEYVVSGQGTLFLNEKSYQVKAGDLYLLFPGYDHLYFSDKKDPFHKIWFNACGTLVGSLLHEYNPQEKVVFSNTDGRKYIERIHEIGRNSEYTAEEKNKKSALVFHELLQYLYDCSYTKENMYCKETLMLKTYLENHVTVNVSLKTLADMVYLSESQVVRIFKRDVGKTPHEYSLELKLERAKMLLRNTQLRVREISESFGFCDEHYFSYIFKKKCGKTPLEFRKRGDRER